MCVCVRACVSVSVCLCLCVSGRTKGGRERERGCIENHSFAEFNRKLLVIFSNIVIIQMLFCVSGRKPTMFTLIIIRCYVIDHTEGKVKFIIMKCIISCYQTPA